MVSDRGNQPQRNSLYSLASGGALLLGFFLLAAAYGHFAAVWSAIENGKGSSGSSRFSLFLPGLILATTGLINIGLCQALWTTRRWALHLALVFNVLAAMYLVYLLLSQDALNHPIGLFVALVSSYIILLASIRIGLIWPTADDAYHTKN